MENPMVERRSLERRVDDLETALNNLTKVVDDKLAPKIDELRDVLAQFRGMVNLIKFLCGTGIVGIVLVVAKALLTHTPPTP